MEQGFFYTVNVSYGADKFTLGEAQGVMLLDFTDGTNRTICFASPELLTQSKLTALNPSCEFFIKRQAGVRAERLEALIGAVIDRSRQEIARLTEQALLAEQT